MPPTAPTASQALHFTSLNDSQPSTILLIHGLQSSHHEWTYITPYLSTYHLLLPDLPGHGDSASISPHTIPHAASLLANLIRAHAHGGAAHIVGLSLGGYTARHLAKTNPELVRSLFVTGAGGLPLRGPASLVARRPKVVGGLFAVASFVGGALPAPVFRAALGWMVGIRGEFAGNVQRGLRDTADAAFLAGWMASIRDFEGPYALPGEVRVLAVAGGKQDDVEATRRLGECLRGVQGGDRNRACVVREAIHAWNLQAGLEEVFASGVLAWIEGRDLPVEYESLVD